MNYEEAITTVARRVIANAAQNAIRDDWDMYPELGEDDWMYVGETVLTILANLLGDDELPRFLKAYLLLESRAIDNG